MSTDTIIRLKFITVMLGVLLAAGKGTRMKSAKSKLLFEVNDEPLCFGAYRALFESCEKVLVVIGHKGPEVKEQIIKRANEVYSKELVQEKTFFFTQEEQKGTGHAVQVALESAQQVVSHYDYCVVLNGDLPLIESSSLTTFLNHVKTQSLDAACMSFQALDPKGLGRIYRSSEGSFLKIIEEKDATESERKICEVNSGVYCFNTNKLMEKIKDLKDNNSQGEVYLTDMLGAEAQASLASDAFLWSRHEDLLGVNTTYELAHVQKLAQRRLKKALCEEYGVEFEDMDSSFVSARAEFKGNAFVGLGCRIGSGSKISRAVVLEGHVQIKNAVVEEGARILWGSVLDGAHVGPGAQIGPMAHLRPGADLGEAVKVGNFVEIKKSRLDKGAKASHLSYLGDAHIGEGSNIGAGTITCNYDGFNKFKTLIGKRAFIGSDSQLVAPVEVGDGAYVGSGTTVTEDVPKGALAISRPDMVIKEGYAEKLNAKKQS